MTYLFIGHDPFKKDAKLSELKAKIMDDPSASAFDYETLSAHKLDPDDLTKSLLAIPHVAKQRLVVVRQCEKLSEHNREIILDFVLQNNKTTILILDYDDMDARSAFYAKLRPHVQLVSFGQDASVNVFDMTRLISGRDTVGAIKILHQLMENNTHPLQIMGGLVWYWGKERERLDPSRFVQGLMVLEEGDLNIKRSKLNPEYAVEKVVVELALLQGA